MSRDSTVIPFRQPEAIDDPLTEVAREGARAPVPAIDDEFRLFARGPVRLQLGDIGLDVEPSCPDAHLRSPPVVGAR